MTRLLGYTPAMRRYPVYLILLLSFAMPLQVVADALLSALPCPDQVSMLAEPSHHSDGEMADMDCCDDAESALTTPDCDSMKNCHLYKTGSQFFTYTPLLITFSRVVPLDAVTQNHAIASFNPADVWRPPTNS